MKKTNCLFTPSKLFCLELMKDIEKAKSSRFKDFEKGRIFSVLAIKKKFIHEQCFL